ncbi:MAG: NAD(P)/FAD-dependent oxidoreductase [Anaerolineae bacterium]
MRTEYAVIVIGAGPAGCIAAATVAERGFKVLLIEKRQEIGSPIRCAEAVTEEGISEFIDPETRWIAAEIDAVRLYAPNGSSAKISGLGTGYVLERKIFDRELASRAANAGADVMVKTHATRLLVEGGKVKGVHINHLGEEAWVTSRIVIAADGVESQVARWAGLDTLPKLRHIGTAVQYLMSDLEIDPQVCEFHFGRQLAPGGYVWVFPKGERMANVGLGIGGNVSHPKTAHHYLREFVDKRFPRNAILGITAGAIPTGATVRKMVTDGLMVAGDAAHHTNPLTGGGIVNAMKAGKLAAAVAIKALEAGDCSERTLRAYEREWHRSVGKSLKRFYRIKEALLGLSDRDFNEAANVLIKLIDEDLTLRRVLITVFKSNPKLLLLIPRVFV